MERRTIGLLGATGYKVYSAQNRFAGFPSGWTVLGTPATTTFLAAGHGTDTLTHYYVVRATTAAGGSFHRFSHNV